MSLTTARIRASVISANAVTLLCRWQSCKSKHKDDRIWAHFVFCSSSKPNSSAMSERFGAMRFWSAYSSDAVRVKMVTM